MMPPRVLAQRRGAGAIRRSIFIKVNEIEPENFALFLEMLSPLSISLACLHYI